MTTLFIVIQEDGEYSDHMKNIYCVYTTLEEAKTTLLKFVKFTAYILEVKVGEIIEPDLALYSSCEGKLIRYKNRYPYNPYYRGTLEHFYSVKNTFNVHFPNEILFEHDHSFRD